MYVSTQLEHRYFEILPVEKIVIPINTFALQLSILEEGPIVIGSSDKTNTAKIPMMFATVSNRAIELITFEVFNFLTMYIMLDT